MKTARVLNRILLWNDEYPKPGPENMAVDQWLAETSSEPVLRIYRWKGEWASLGYFSHIEKARILFPDCSLVRRWTGGGMVDHRNDWTYTLSVPAHEPLARLRGNEVYSTIHKALGTVLLEEGIDARLMTGNDASNVSPLCFERPVCWDVVTSNGDKLAGAGQRRGRFGLLHQGSVSVSGVSNSLRGIRLAEVLANEVVSYAPIMEDCLVSKLTNLKYEAADWLNAR